LGRVVSITVGRRSTICLRSLGCWTSLDPLGFDAGDPNLYRFVFNAPTVYADPSGLILPYVIGGLLSCAGLYIGGKSYQSTGTPFSSEIWGAAAEGVVCVDPRVIVNSVSDTVVSAVALGGVDRLELWPVPPEYRDAYEWGYAGSRPLWEVEAALLTRKLPTKLQPYGLALDTIQNGVLVSRGLLDVPQIPRHRGRPVRWEWSEGMLLHGPTWTNSNGPCRWPARPGRWLGRAPTAGGRSTNRGRYPSWCNPRPRDVG
jgi:hypothetical protein